MNDLTLSIVSHGHGPVLQALLQDLAALPGIGSAHVIVTLNLASEEFDAAAHASMNITLRRNRQPRGFGANHNAAFRDCKTAWFAVLNPDLRIQSNPFARLLATASARPDVALLAPRVLGPGGEPEDSVRANLTLPSLLARHLLRRRVPLDALATGTAFYWLAGMFMLIRASAFRAIDGFDERYFLYCEDYDLCARLRSAGHALVFDPGAEVVHDARRASHRSLQHLAWHVSGLLKVWSSAAFWRTTLGTRRRRGAGAR